MAAHELVVLPVWDKNKARHEFDVDHLMELQVGGLDGWENFWVLDASANRSSGSKINSTLTRDVDALIDAAQAGHFWGTGPGGPKPTVEEALANWKLHFDGFKDLSISGDKTNYWTREEVQRGDHLAGLKAMTEREIANAGLRFRPGDRPTFINVFSGPQAGFFKRLNRKGSSDEWQSAGAAAGFYRGFDLTGIQIDPFDSIVDGRKIGTLTGRAFTKASKENKLYTPPEFSMDLKQSTRLGFGVYVDREPLNQALAALREFKKTSPVQIEDGGLSADGTLFVEGRIIASIPLFQGVEIPFSIAGDTITLEFPIPTDRLRLGPIEVTDAAIEISVGPSGLELGGGINFTVRGIGSGRLEAQVGTAAPRPAPAAAGASPGAGAAPAEGAPSEPGFSFTGSFNFDSDKLDPATVTVAYANHQFSVDATVGLAAGAVRGIESAQIHVFSGPEGIAADGEAVLGVPPLQGTRLIVRRAVDGSIEIAAENIPLPVSGIPGITGATASVRVSRNPDTGEWRLSGGGSAAIAIAGVTGVLSVDVNGPFLTIAGQNLVISRPPLQGSGAFRVTNQPMDEAGNPMEGEPGPMTASGHAEATMPLGSFLTATIGGTFMPNGELLFTGTVALPPTVDLFERREFNRVLFEPPSLDIPLLGVTAAGQRIGIFATIGGSLSFIAGIGPGQLRNAALTATFNPDRPQDTTVEGQAQFFIPADAGLQLAIHGGIGAGIPIVSAEAGIEVTGALGITGEAAADVGVRWTPQEGLSAEAIAHLAARPQFTFGINAYLSITADVVITEFELYSERWNLASYSFGPQLEIGVDIPVRWSEQAGLDFDVNQIEVQRPDIDFAQLGGDLMGALIG